MFDGARDGSRIDDILAELSVQIDPDNGKRRPQDLKELWVALQWAKTLPASRLLDLKLYKSEAPDFTVTEGCKRYGMEITEAANPDEREYTIRQRHLHTKGPSEVYGFSQGKQERIERAVDWICTSLENKAEKLSSYGAHPVELLIYFNSPHLIAIDGMEIELELLKGIAAVEHRFRAVYLYHSRLGVIPLDKT